MLSLACLVQFVLKVKPLTRPVWGANFYQAHLMYVKETYYLDARSAV